MRAAGLLLGAVLLASCARAAPRTLAEAAARGSAAEVTAQLDRDPARLDLAGDDGDTPLRIAARAGNVEALRVLIRRGAAPDLADVHGRSALHLAAIADHADAIRMLVRAGADWRLEDLDGRTPLLEAVAAHRRDAAAALREIAGTSRSHHGPVTKLFGDTRRETPAERVFRADTAGRAAASELEWSGAGGSRGVMLRIDRGDRPHFHRESGEVHAFVATGSVRASASGANDVDLEPGGFVTIPAGQEHGWRCLSPSCLVYEEEWPAQGALAVLTTAGGQSLDVWHDEATTCTARVETLSPMNSGTHDHPFEFLAIVSGGTIRYSIADDTPKELPPGSVVVIPAKVKHAINCAAGSPCVRFYEQCGD